MGVLESDRFSLSVTLLASATEVSTESERLCEARKCQLEEQRAVVE
eukprot:COSAG06_NODE_22304_length_726_cov_5.321656_1_plen_45_part_10